jgi:hypothetical protein
VLFARRQYAIVFGMFHEHFSTPGHAASRFSFHGYFRAFAEKAFAVIFRVSPQAFRQPATLHAAALLAFRAASQPAFSLYVKMSRLLLPKDIAFATDFRRRAISTTLAAAIAGYFRRQRLFER